MNLYLKILLTSLALLFGAQSQAQINAPEFQCVKSDTLFWEAPSFCGPFNSYQIYTSPNQAGPFTLLTNITNQTQNSYYNPNPSAAVIYYYMTSDMDCPGQPIVSSDTLNNRPPERAPIQFVSVQGNDVVLNWNPSPSPEVEAYVIYREEAIGVVPLDTVYSGTFYLDTNADPNNQTQTYFVLALDPCQNTSVFGDAHTTMLLELESEVCNAGIDLSWNEYQTWMNGIEKYEIWASESGGNFAQIGEVDGGSTTFSYSGFTDNLEYCFYVNAIENVTGYVSTSSVDCITADINQPVTTLKVKNASIIATDQIRFSWQWNANAEVDSFEIFRSENGVDYTKIHATAPILPLGTERFYVDNLVSTDVGPYYYKIETLDFCSQKVVSDIGKTIYLDGENDNESNSNLLNWNELVIDSLNVGDYEIYTINNFIPQYVATVQPNQLTYAALLEGLAPTQAEVCYRIVANSTFNPVDSAPQSIQTQSNVFCVTREPDIRMPNAFAPLGKNNEFRPVIYFGELAIYELNIFNRFGERLFQSTDYEQGWNGRMSSNAYAPAGVYLYQLNVTQTNGKSETFTGSFALIK